MLRNPPDRGSQPCDRGPQLRTPHGLAHRVEADAEHRCGEPDALEQLAGPEMDQMTVAGPPDYAEEARALDLELVEQRLGGVSGKGGIRILAATGTQVGPEDLLAAPVLELQLKRGICQIDLVGLHGETH